MFRSERGKKNSMFRPESEETERILFWVGSAVFGVLAAVMVLIRLRGMPGDSQAFFFACPLYTITGYYCPGCGGTRAFAAFFAGQFRRSFRYHPAVCYGLAYVFLFMGSRILNGLTRGRTPKVRFRMAYVFLGIFLILLNFFVKNWLHFRTGIDILECV